MEVLDLLRVYKAFKQCVEIGEIESSIYELARGNYKIERSRKLSVVSAWHGTSSVNVIIEAVSLTTLAGH